MCGGSDQQIAQGGIGHRFYAPSSIPPPPPPPTPRHSTLGQDLGINRQQEQRLTSPSSTVVLLACQHQPHTRRKFADRPPSLSLSHPQKAPRQPATGPPTLLSNQFRSGESINTKQTSQHTSSISHSLLSCFDTLIPSTGHSDSSINQNCSLTL